VSAGLLTVDLVGVAVFASSGALLAVRRGLDILGGVVLGGATALGGGILRDVILGEVPPAALRQVAYVLTAAAAASLTYFLHGSVDRLRRPFVLLDAAGLALFCVSGTFKALDADLSVLSAMLLGALTAVGGGVLRDVLVRDVPLILQPGQFYALAALAGGAVTALLDAVGAVRTAAGIAGAATALALRLGSLIRGWRTLPPPGTADA
jgi:uncharacterized membrane protein YeiH